MKNVINDCVCVLGGEVLIDRGYIFHLNFFSVLNSIKQGYNFAEGIFANW